MLTQAELKEFIHYAPETGVFTRVKSFGTRVERFLGPMDLKPRKPSRICNFFVCNQQFSASRWAWLYMTGDFPPRNVIYFVNNNTFDFRWSNLARRPPTQGELTQELLKQWLLYDPETGVFTWNACAADDRRDRPAGAQEAQGYVTIYVVGKARKAHRLAWLYMHGSWPTEEIDHINGNRTDNRLVNLREANRRQNNYNMRMRPDNTSGVKGVCWHRRLGKWQASARDADGRNVHIGYFSDKAAAAAARKIYAQKLYGEFARDA